MKLSGKTIEFNTKLYQESTGRSFEQVKMNISLNE